MLNVGTKVKVKPEFLVGDNAKLFLNHVATITQAYDTSLGTSYKFEFGDDVDVSSYKTSIDVPDEYKRMMQVYGEECFEIIENK